MNYYDARRRQDTGKFDYTRMNDGHISPVGYCAEKDGCSCRTIKTGYQINPDCEICGGSGRVPNPDYCGSHDTEEEARECFARYLLDGWREVSFSDWTGCQYRVVVGEDDFGGTHREQCDKPTKQGLETRPPLGESFALCDEHRTFECLRFLAAHDAGQITASY